MNNTPIDERAKYFPQPVPENILKFPEPKEEVLRIIENQGTFYAIQKKDGISQIHTYDSPEAVLAAAEALMKIGLKFSGPNAA